ncbi:MAG: ribosome biogenesis GTPase Der [Phycisphaerae bacterium]
MALPVVAIVGRPNVGKSSLLNALAGRRISIVDPQPGVTRDRVSAVIEHDGVWFELIDTGGYGIEDRDQLTGEIERQIGLAVESASLILFVVDLHAEITPLDQAVARLLRGRNERVWLIANKTDTPQHESGAALFARLGFGPPRAVSALHARGIKQLLSDLAERLGKAAELPGEPVLKIAILGRQNVGKSSFINGLAQAPRVIVSEIPGTTRDSIDVRFEMDGRTLMAIDTAGIRKKARADKQGIDYYGALRAEQAALRADVVLLMLDATASVTEVDKKLARFLAEECKPVIVVVNKWDLAKGRATSDDYADYVARALPQVTYAPLAFTTATSSRNLKSVVDLAQSLFKQARTRVTTGQLNRAIQAALAERQPTSDSKGRAPRIFFATQVATCPPTIVLFVNNPAFLREDYRRFFTKQLAAALPFPEIPIRLLWRAKRPEPADQRGQRIARARRPERR